MLSETAANEVIVALKARLKQKRDKHYQEMRDAITRASECQHWLNELDREIRQQQRFEPVAEQGADNE